RAKGLTDEPQQRVAGQMALSVVDLFETVDVDERDHERGAGAMCALELARNLLEPEPASPRAGQFVGRREPQVVCGFHPVPQRRCTLVAHCGHGGPVATRSLTRQSAPVIGTPVATGREIIVSSVLILIRASLIARTRGLVVIRPRLILITHRLVGIRPRLILLMPRLIAISRRVITDLTDATRQELGSTRRTARNRANFAAGRAPHNLRHRVVASPSERTRTNGSHRLPVR